MNAKDNDEMKNYLSPGVLEHSLDFDIVCVRREERYDFELRDHVEQLVPAAAYVPQPVKERK